MKIYGRRLLDREKLVKVEFDELVFEVGKHQEIVVSIYRAMTDKRIEVRANDGRIVVLPCASNSIEIETRR